MIDLRVCLSRNLWLHVRVWREAFSLTTAERNLNREWTAVAMKTVDPAGLALWSLQGLNWSKKRLLEPLSSVIILGPFSTAGQIDNFFFCTIHWNKRNHDSRYWVGNEILSISRGGGGRSAIWIWQVHSLWLEIAEFDLVWVGQDGKAAFLPLNWYCLGLFVKKNPHNDCHLRLCSYHTGWHFVMWTLIHDLCDST